MRIILNSLLSLVLGIIEIVVLVGGLLGGCLYLISFLTARF